jgi:hypothetical protein
MTLLLDMLKLRVAIVHSAIESGMANDTVGDRQALTPRR